MSQTELNLDQLLAGMAEDVPPMPEDFHDRWMNAVRAEAQKADEPAEAPTPVSQWTRILSIAAVFAFLIGGTFIYRSARKPIMPGNGFENTEAVTETVETEETTITGTAAEKAAYSADDAGPRMDAAGETGFAAVNPAAEGPMMNMAEEIPLPEAADEAAEADFFEEETAAEADFFEEETAAEAAATETPATAAPASVSEVREGIGGFFADMGDFLLAIWPYLLAALVLLAMALTANRIRKKQ